MRFVENRLILPQNEFSPGHKTEPNCVVTPTSKATLTGLFSLLFLYFMRFPHRQTVQGKHEKSSCGLSRQPLHCLIE
jgi:hypothetical protein